MSPASNEFLADTVRTEVPRPDSWEPAVSQTTLQNASSNDNQNARMPGLRRGLVSTAFFDTMFAAKVHCLPPHAVPGQKASHKDNCGRSSVFVDKIQKTKVEEFHVSQESDDAP
jgi:hypothetical protein